MQQPSALVAELRKTLGKLESALNLISDALVITSNDGTVSWCNKPFTEIVNLAKIQIIGRNIYEIAPRDVHGQTIFNDPCKTESRRAEDKINIAIISNNPLKAIETSVNTIDSELGASLIFCIRDITSALSYRTLLEKTELMKQRVSKITETNRKLKRAEQMLSRQICECPVTGLPNRRGLIRYLERIATRQSSPERLIALFFCDLNGFKQINDTHGHQTGDELLIEISARLASTLRPQDLVSRLGGDEFIAVSDGLNNINEAHLIASRLHQAVGQPWTIEAATIKPHMSVGIAISTAADVVPDELIRRADIAMYEAKCKGQSQTKLFSGDSDEKHRQSLRRIELLKRRIEENNINMAFQPIFNLKDRSLYGYEALIRIAGENNEHLETLEMISLAEKNQLISTLGDMSLEKTIEALAKAEALNYRIAINASPLEVANENYATGLLQRLEKNNIPPSSIQIEVTESTLISNLRSTAKTLATLRNEGVSVFLDDFGTGYSSLSLLSDLPSDGIKIDKSFVGQLGIDQSKTLVVKTIISLCNTLELCVIAEGIENNSQLKLLLEFNCPLGQGYFLGKPMPKIQPLDGGHGDPR